jgi:uncharacterized protein (DUF433 family)
MDWLTCEAIEAIPGKMNGRPVIKGTRVEPDTIVDNYEAGSPIEEVHENYPHIPLDTIRRVLAFHRTRSHQLVG